MICWLLHPSYNDTWQRYSSQKAAREQFADDTYAAINHYGQSEEAWVEAWVVVGRERPSGDAYPSYILKYDLDTDEVQVVDT